MIKTKYSWLLIIVAIFIFLGSIIYPRVRYNWQKNKMASNMQIIDRSFYWGVWSVIAYDLVFPIDPSSTLTYKLKFTNVPTPSFSVDSPQIGVCFYDMKDIETIRKMALLLSINILFKNGDIKELVLNSGEDRIAESPNVLELYSEEMLSFKYDLKNVEHIQIKTISSSKIVMEKVEICINVGTGL